MYRTTGVTGMARMQLIYGEAGDVINSQDCRGLSQASDHNIPLILLAYRLRTERLLRGRRDGQAAMDRPP